MVGERSQHLWTVVVLVTRGNLETIPGSQCCLSKYILIFPKRCFFKFCFLSQLCSQRLRFQKVLVVEDGATGLVEQYLEKQQSHHALQKPLEKIRRQYNRQGTQVYKQYI